MGSDAFTDRLHAYLVRDVMTRGVRTVRPTATLLEAARLMRSGHVSGLPVVDLGQHPVGVVSESDILRQLDRSTGIASPRGILDLLLAAGGRGPSGRLEGALDQLKKKKVAEAMSRPLISVEPDAPLAEAAHLLHQYSINRLPVQRDGRLVGILSRQDVVVAVSGPTVKRRFARRSAVGK